MLAMNLTGAYNAYPLVKTPSLLSLTFRFEDWADMSFKKLRQLFVIKGNGQLSTEEHSVSSFLRLHLSLPCTLELIDSEEEKVLITTDENLQSLISTVNSSRTLYIGAGNPLKTPDFSSLKIQVFVRQLDTLNIGADSGDVIMTEPYVSRLPLDIKIQSSGNSALLLSAPAIKLNNQSNGNLKIAGACTVFNAKAQSNGDFDAKNLLAQNVTFSSQSNGNAWIYGSESLVIKHGSNGFVHYYGDGILKDIKHFGTGVVKHCKA